jgi:chorismate lyase/3-hydroxybenzoate synthase
MPVENPRQRPSYIYSRRYGPRPPCFSRATMIPARGGEPARLLVGGTASVVGEDSMHAGNLAAQIDETLRNLASLVAAAGGAAGNSRGLKALRRFTELRIYRPRAGDDKQIDQTVAAHFPQSRTEYVSADLCRKELLVEIEGVAILKGLR